MKIKKLFLGAILTLIFMICGATTAFAAESDINSELPYIIKEGTVYYETSYQFGSGRNGTVNEKNEYITIPCYAGINGYSFLDENGNVLKSDYIESENDISIPEAPEGAVRLFKHFKSTSYRNGWVDAGQVILNEDITSDEEEKELLDEPEQVKERPEEQKPEEIVEDIQSDIQKEDKKTTISIDFSGSMSDNQREVVKLIETLDFNENTTIIVFASRYEVITKEQLISRDFSVGNSTYMIEALNKAIELGTEHLIVISDLQTSTGELEKSETLKSVVIYDPDDNYEDAIVDEMLKPTWDKATISRVRIK